MKQMKNHNFYDNCMLCPRTCGAQRSKGKTGICGVTETLKVARAALHFWEEPCISGTKGSGAVFFSGCALHCVFCQNEPIAQGTAGKKITPERLVEIFLELQEQGGEQYQSGYTGAVCAAYHPGGRTGETAGTCGSYCIQYGKL